MLGFVHAFLCRNWYIKHSESIAAYPLSCYPYIYALALSWWWSAHRQHKQITFQKTSQHPFNLRDMFLSMGLGSYSTQEYNLTLATDYSRPTHHSQLKHTVGISQVF